MAGLYSDGVQRGAPLEVPGGEQACERCGTFAALTWSWGRKLCPECRARLHPALTTPRKTLVLVREIFSLLPAIGWRGVLVTLAPLPFVAAVRLWIPPADTGNARRDALRDLGPHLFFSLFTGTACAVITCVLLQVLIGDGKPDYPTALRSVRSRFGAMLGISLTLALVGDLAYAVLNVVGTILVWTSFALVYPIALHERVSAPAALRRSAFRMQYNVSPLLGLGCLYGLAMLLGIVAIGIVLAAGDVTDVERHSPLARLMTGMLEGASEFLTLPLTAASVLLYVKLPPRMAQ
ncbi:MAG TPA: hypothetical protein VHM19_10210 [Polyangiales bacterium]|nr:hypothetical protein [Polyangiales bacterium]